MEETNSLHGWTRTGWSLTVGIFPWYLQQIISHRHQILAYVPSEHRPLSVLQASKRWPTLDSSTGTSASVSDAASQRTLDLPTLRAMVTGHLLGGKRRLGRHLAKGATEARLARQEQPSAPRRFEPHLASPRPKHLQADLTARRHRHVSEEPVLSSPRRSTAFGVGDGFARAGQEKSHASIWDTWGAASKHNCNLLPRQAPAKGTQLTCDCWTSSLAAAPHLRHR